MQSSVHVLIDRDFLGYLSRQDERAPHNLLTLTGEKHAERRRAWNRALNTDALDEYDEILVKNGLQLVEGMQANSHGEVDLTAWFNYFRYGPHVLIVIRNRTNGHVAASILWLTLCKYFIPYPFISWCLCILCTQIRRRFGFAPERQG